MNDFQVGDVVVMIDDRFHYLKPEFFPKAWTLGKVRKIEGDDLLVAWATGSTSEDDTWYISSPYVRRVVL